MLYCSCLHSNTIKEIYIYSHLINTQTVIKEMGEEDLHERKKKSLIVEMWIHPLVE